MLRIVLLLLVSVFVAFGEHRIVKMIPFGEHNLKIIFAQPVDTLEWQIKTIQDGRSFVDFQANLTIPRRHFIFKDNSTLQIAQNTPQIVRLVFNLHENSFFELVKEKENLYVFIKPKKNDEKSVEKSVEKKNKNTESNGARDDKESGSSKDTNSSKNAKPLDSQNKQTNLQDKNRINSKSDTKTSLSKTDLKLSGQGTEPEKTKTPPPPKSAQSSKASKIGSGRKIVIDAGHGGKDCGTTSVEGICEKTIVLEVAKFLSQELKDRGYMVFMTRSSDVYIDLRKRTEFANTRGADLFVSVHANSMPKDSPKTPSGVETYFLSPARSERAEQVAKVENQGDIETMSHFATKSFLNTISTFHLVASHKLAIEIQSSILDQVRQKYNTHDGAVREGPFWVLAGALMPSVLIEIGYASHKLEGKLIAKKEYQKLLAKGIADGVDGYFLRNY